MPFLKGEGMKYFGIWPIMFLIVTVGSSQDERNLLQNEAQEINLAGSLLGDFNSLGFPTYRDREFWDNIPGKIREKYIAEAETYLDYDWPVIKATDYLEIIRTGGRNQHLYGIPRGAITALVMGELMEGEGRFIDQIINGSWYYSEQTWWGWSPHLKHQKAAHGLPDIDEPLVDLGVGEMTNVLSWTWYLFKEEFDKIHPLIATRLKGEIMRKAVIPFYERSDFWWMGLDEPRRVNNWVPWVNHNLLMAILILEDNPAQRLAGVEKVLRGVDVFLNQYPDDGACDEGPSYWGHAGAAMYENLDLLSRATEGKFDIYNEDLISNIGSYIYKAYIDYPYFINFADADATTSSRPQIIYCYGKDIKDLQMQEFGAFLARKGDWGSVPMSGKIDEQIIQLMLLDEIKAAPSKNVLISDFWLPNTEVAGGRDQEGSSAGFFFAAKGGHNSENHNHNDVGSCVMYYNGKPCLIDLGRETYVAKTFSAERYDIWTMQSQYHNTPKINGLDQLPGVDFRAMNPYFKASDNQIVFTADIGRAYPEMASVSSWLRTYILNRGKDFRIKDQFEYNAHPEKETNMNLITYCKVSKHAPGVLHLKGDDFLLALEYDPKIVSPRIEYYEVKDAGLMRYWPLGVTRIVFEIILPGGKGENELVFRPM